jgi:hypothetical protein
VRSQQDCLNPCDRFFFALHRWLCGRTANFWGSNLNTLASPRNHTYSNPSPFRSIGAPAIVPYFHLNRTYRSLITSSTLSATLCYVLHIVWVYTFHYTYSPITPLVESLLSCILLTFASRAGRNTYTIHPVCIQLAITNVMSKRLLVYCKFKMPVKYLSYRITCA